eukprot:1045779-Prorocentrum_minimum.AAC.4
MVAPPLAWPLAWISTAVLISWRTGKDRKRSDGHARHLPTLGAIGGITAFAPESKASTHLPVRVLTGAEVLVKQGCTTLRGCKVRLRSCTNHVKYGQLRLASMVDIATWRVTKGNGVVALLFGRRRLAS